MSLDHHHLHAILLKYLPSTLAETSLERALTECQLTRHTCERRHLPAVIAKLDASIRLFVEPGDHTRIREELGALLGQRLESALSVAIRSEPDVSRARLLMRRVCTDLSVRPDIAQRCITIVSELARNIVSYTPGGTIEIQIEADERQFRIRARDQGRGIKNLPEILGGGYQSKTGLGKGILGVKRLAQSFDIKTGAQGTEIRAEVGW